MADRPKLIRRKPAQEDEPEDINEDLDESMAGEAEDLEEGDDGDDGEDAEEESEPAPKVAVTAKPKVAVTAKKTVVAAPVPAKKVVVPAPAAKPAVPVAKPAPKVAVTAKPKVAVPAKPAPKVAAHAEEDAAENAAPATVKVRKVDDVVADNILTSIMDALANGQSVTITRMDDNKWVVGPAGAKAVQANSGKLVGVNYEQEVCTAEYLQFNEEWQSKTASEKESYAKKVGAAWKSIGNPQVDLIHMTQAVREKLGIQKYKPEYESRKAREALRGQ